MLPIFGRIPSARRLLIGCPAILKPVTLFPVRLGLRKVRWARQGMGKRGGARVIYFNRLENGEIWLLIVYAKAKFDNLPAAFLNKLKEEINNG